MEHVQRSKQLIDAHVDISGHVRTDDEFMKSMYGQVARSQTLGELDSNLRDVSARLGGMDCFHSVTADVTLNKQGQDSKGNDDMNAKYNAHVKVNVSEKGPLTLKLETNIKPTTGVLTPGNELSFGLRNPLGLGESLRWTKDDAQGRGSSYSLTGAVPSENYDWTTAFKSGDEVGTAVGAGPGATLGPKVTGRSAELAAATLDGKHKLTMGLAWRDEQPRCRSETPKWDMSPELCMQSQASTTTSVKWLSTLFSTLDHPMAPTSGTAVKSELELAVPPGTSLFARAIATFEAYRTVGAPVCGQRGLSISCTSTVGGLLPFVIKNSAISDTSLMASKLSAKLPTFENVPSTFSDRFHLGGCASGPRQPGLRGFDVRGCGPRSTSPGAGDPLGGDFIGTFLLAATAPVPHLSVAGWLRTLVFVNAGTISGKLTTVNPMDVVRSTRVSAGVGLLLNLSPIRVGLSYSVPVVKAPHDVLAPWQLGLALEIA